MTPEITLDSMRTELRTMQGKVVVDLRLDAASALVLCGALNLALTHPDLQDPKGVRLVVREIRSAIGRAFEKCPVLSAVLGSSQQGGGR